MFALAAGLAIFGAMMVYSASAMIAVRETGGASQFTYFYKQGAFTLAGLTAMFAARVRMPCFRPPSARVLVAASVLGACSEKAL